MRQMLLVLGLCVLFVGGEVQAKEVEGVFIPQTLQAGDEQLTLQGAGVRSKFFFDLYVGALYLNRAQSSAQEIIAADAPMAIRLHIISKLITSKKMEKATREGFEQVTQGNLSSLEQRVDSFIQVFKQEAIEKDDVFALVYVPGQGVQTRKNGTLLARIPGLDFKQALFAIWLSKNPVQKSLRESMLGR